MCPLHIEGEGQTTGEKATKGSYVMYVRYRTIPHTVVTYDSSTKPKLAVTCIAAKNHKAMIGSRVFIANILSFFLFPFSFLPLLF